MGRVGRCMHNACMTVLTIRDVPDQLNDLLKARAKEQGQSVQQFVLRGLWRLAEESPLEQRLADFLADLPDVTVSRSRLLESIDEARAERDPWTR